MNTPTSTEALMQALNAIFSQLLSSIDSTVFSLLDNLAFLTPSMLHFSWFEKIWQSHGILFIADALLLGVCLYYVIRLVFSYYIGTESIERPYQFLFKLLLYGICIHSSLFLCEQCLQIHALLSESIRSIGTSVTGNDISFVALIEKLHHLLHTEDFTLFSFEGILKSFISVSLLNLVFSYALRYMLLLVFVLLFPFALLTLINYATRSFFQAWCRCFLSLLVLEYIVDFILLLIFSIPFEENEPFSLLLLLGCMYALIRSNQYVQQLVGGISTTVSSQISSFIKHR